MLLNQMFAYVTNADSVTINKGQPVYAFGASGDRMSVKLADNTTEATSSKTVGLIFSSSIAPGATGFVITQGVLSNVNTGAYSPGDTLYVGASAGTLTNTMPYAPNHLTRIGIVERANAGNGLIYVLVQNGFQLDELSDVNTVHLLPGSPCPPHAAPIASGSSTVKVNGMGAGRVGDAISGCTSVAAGSGNVFAG